MRRAMTLLPVSEDFQLRRRDLVILSLFIS